MPDLSSILTSAATLVQQADAQADASVKESLYGAARTLLQTADAQLVAGAIPAPAVEEDDGDD